MTIDPEKVRDLQERASREGLEFRYLTRPVEMRAAGDAVRQLVGHASVFDTDTPIGPASDPYWIERVERGAFRASIAEDDIRALFNHNEDLVLGRNRAGTLRLSEDAVGLFCEITPPDTSVGRDCVVSVDRGDITQMSIGFQVRKQMWEELPDGTVRRTVQAAMLWDVSPVTFPAFPTTDIAVREARAKGWLPPLGILADTEEIARRSLSRARTRLAFIERTV